jgi:hypothetical protein
MSFGEGDFLRLDSGFFPLGPGNARDVEQDPDLSRRTFDPKRMNDLPEVY